MNRIEASYLVARSSHEFNDGKTLARRIRGLFNHYRQFRGLPAETRRGKRKGTSYLDNEDVFQACRAWLTSQELGTVTPADFRRAVNEEILPRLMITTEKPLALSTVYLWLLRLGFHTTESKKGVYVDGYEREDVIKYRQQIFLLVMEKLLALIVQYEEREDGTWSTIQPVLPKGEKRYVMYFHDESCFHGHDYKKKIWLDMTVDQQKMPGKSKGRLIYDSEFIGPEGRIRVRGEDGEYYPDDLDLDARKIIYLGSNGDPW